MYLLFEIVFLQEGQFVWLSGDPVVFNSFRSGQPDDDKGEDCIELSNMDSNWQDTYCNFASIASTQFYRPICKQEQTATSESMDALSDMFDFMLENAPIAAAVGGVAASTALVANPSLPMTGSNGVPPGIYVYFLLSM